MFITYYKTYATLKKHVDNDHATVAKKIEEEINVLRRGPIERQLTKKKIVLGSIISKFFLSKILFKMIMNSKNTFCNTLVF